ncbi:MAG: hypothetical protein RQ899_14730, partial [Pseudomonadales bacterium]|nr:hypothetical protein [Pseudomonadales bacterium]
MLSLLLALVAAFFFFDAGSWLTLDAIKAEQDRFESWRQNFPWLFVAAFFGLYVLITALSVPGATVM